MNPTVKRYLEVIKQIEALKASIAARKARIAALKGKVHS